MGKAYLRAATIDNAENDFWKCGICQFNPGVFRDSDFSIDVSSELATESRSNENQGPGISQFIHEESTSLCTSVGPVSPTQANLSTASTSKVFLRPTDISHPPLTKKPATSTARTTQSGKAALITRSPYKRQLEESMSRLPNPKKPKFDKAFPKRQRQIQNCGGEGSTHEERRRC
ncbi:hypothetical protein PR048_009696 [Dryococelus australis]|uniref:Uncharacterized protein n=1 Tax=Dryococelus australis TaxID=614101 RepID=A0ABQ9I0P1_9NEOP|nr:hypothetical protein PR048_009696 [Dryococelus australis]